MKRFLGKLFVIAGLFLGLFGISFIFYLNQLEAGSGPHSKLAWAAMVGSVCLFIAAWRLPLKGRFAIFMLMITLIGVECVLQAACWIGILPGVNTMLRVPYGRTYWTSEGRGNSIRNRFGWNSPPFDEKATHRIAFIGDSQVEALEVSNKRNQAACLERLLHSPDWTVMSLGTRGTALAFYIEVLEYSIRHFHPQDAIIVVSLGSDITEATPSLNGLGPERFIYYDLAPDGGLILNPESVSPCALFNRSLELPHASILINLPQMLMSHCMTLQLGSSLRDAMQLRRRRAEFAQRASKMGGQDGPEFQRLGFNPAPFAVNPDAESRKAMALIMAQILRCREICQSNGMTMQLVTLPSFPPLFFNSQQGTNWTMHIGNYDYLGPERELVNFAATNRIPMAAVGLYLQGKHLSVEEVRSLYFSNGVGHLTEKGHQVCAEAIYEAFYGGTNGLPGKRANESR